MGTDELEEFEGEFTCHHSSCTITARDGPSSLWVDRAYAVPQAWSKCEYALLRLSLPLLNWPGGSAQPHKEHIVYQEHLLS